MEIETIATLLKQDIQRTKRFYSSLAVSCRPIVRSMGRNDVFMPRMVRGLVDIHRDGRNVPGF